MSLGYVGASLVRGPLQMGGVLLVSLKSNKRGTLRKRRTPLLALTEQLFVFPLHTRCRILASEVPSTFTHSFSGGGGVIRCMAIP